MPMFRRIAFAFALLLFMALCHDCEAARGFNATMGVGSTDWLQGGSNITVGTTISQAAWIWINGGGGSNFGVVGGITPTGCSGATNGWVTNMDGGTSIMEVRRTWSGGGGVWTWSAPATGGWHHWAITYDGSSISILPTVYIDGGSVSVSVHTAVSGFLAKITAQPLIGGCNGSFTFDGKLAEEVFWNNTILTQAEVTALAKGASPLKVRPESLTFYVPMFGNTSSEVDWSPNHYAVTVTGTAHQNHAPTQTSQVSH